MQRFLAFLNRQKSPQSMELEHSDTNLAQRHQSMQYSQYDHHDMARTSYQNSNSQDINLYSGWNQKAESELKWRCQKIDQMDSSIYNIRMTNDQRTMLVGTQSSMFVFNCENGIRPVINFKPNNITWTISDIDISDDSTFALSCSLNQFVSLYDLENNKVLEEFNLYKTSNDQNNNENFGLRLYSCKMSADKCALIGGSGAFQHGNSLIQYFDTTKNKVVHSIRAHKNDINTIGFVQREQSSVLLSGSDDALIKVWDIRALGVTKKPVGILYGHFAGVTNVDTRNDGVYVCSNSKDQSLKLWDLRQMTTDDKLPIKMCRFDYRYGAPRAEQLREYRANDQEIHADHSVGTFQSHQIHGTLIRCHFSPKLTTNSEYIISASADGNVYIYSMHDPKQKPIIIQEKTQTIDQASILDKTDKQKPDFDVHDDEDWQSDYSSNNNNEDENDDLMSYRGGQYIIRDVAWNDTSIIVGDLGGNLKEYKPI